MFISWLIVTLCLVLTMIGLIVIMANDEWLSIGPKILDEIK